MTKLKMFVWEDILTDYTSGIVCVLAHSKEEAYEVMKRKSEDQEEGWFWKWALEEVINMEPKVIEKPDAVGVSGGG